MRLLLVCVALLAFTNAAQAVATPAGEVNVDTGRIIVNGQAAEIVRRYDGQLLELRSEHLVSGFGKNPGYFLSIFRDKADPAQQTRTRHLIIIDASGKEVRRSNVLDTGLDFQWGDNNYVLFEGNTMYFGIYAPKRMQFTYHDGVLEENKGPWRGPAKPEKYIEPTGDDPCGNVNGVEECREEIARDRARQAQQKRHKSKPKAATP